MQKRPLFIVIIIILLAGVGYLLLHTQGTDEEYRIDSGNNTTGSIGVGEQDTTKDSIRYDVSLAAFAQQEFVGNNLTLGQVLAENASYTRYYVTYNSNGLTISGIMNIPKGEVPAEGFPVLLLNHGYIDPAIYTNGRGLKREQDYLSRQGYVVLHSDYRNHAQSDKDTQVDESLRLGYAVDVVNAVNAMKASTLPYFDITKIGMLGHSMGGGVALQIMTALPDTAQAYVLFAPVSADARDNFDKWIRRERPSAQTILETYGDFDANPAFWNGISPNQYFSAITAPVLYHHGTLDESVPLEWSDRAVEQMESAEVDVEYYVYEGEKHEFINQWPLVMRRTTDFFDAVLKR